MLSVNREEREQGANEDVKKEWRLRRRRDQGLGKKEKGNAMPRHQDNARKQSTTERRKDTTYEAERRNMDNQRKRWREMGKRERAGTREGERRRLDEPKERNNTGKASKRRKEEKKKKERNNKVSE